MSYTNGSSSLEMDPILGRQLHQSPEKTYGTSSSLSIMDTHSSASNQSSTAQTGKSMPPALERHLSARDDPINARMNDPRREQALKVALSSQSLARPLNPRIVGAFETDHDGPSEQDKLLKGVGATLG